MRESVGVDPVASRRAVARGRAGARERMRARMRRRAFKRGERLIAQGGPGDALWLLVEGAAQVTISRGDGEPDQVIGFARAGEVLGEMALITGERRAASVHAETDGSALVLSARDFDAMARADREVAIVLTNLVADRLGTKSTDALSAKRVGRHRIERCVGRGAMGIVYEAIDERDGGRVALKMMGHHLVHEPGARELFAREAAVLRGFTHRNVAGLLETFAALRTEFLALEYCDGPALSTWIFESGPTDEPTVRAIAGQIAAALRALHGAGVIHRDLKPGNVLLARDGTAKVSDFGLAAPLEEILREHALSQERDGGGLAGTPLYMAPEQFDDARADRRTDLHAFGCILAELLLGDVPYGATGLHELIEEKQAFEMPERLRCAVSPPLADLIGRLLSPDPGRREIDLAAVEAWAAPIDARRILAVARRRAPERIAED
jgi:CRP-like cAMP-binding protein